MQSILSDYNCIGHARAIFRAIEVLDLLDLAPMQLITFDEVGLSMTTDDETLWRFCQQKRYLLLTGNRTSKDGALSLEAIIQRFITPESLPVLTIGDVDRVLLDRHYCARCAARLADIVFDLQTYQGVTRLYLS